METEVDVPNPKLELVPGMYANASLTPDAGAGRRWSRRSRRSIAQDDTDARVLVVGSDGTLEARAGDARPRDRRIASRCAAAWPPATSSSSAAARS